MTRNAEHAVALRGNGRLSHRLAERGDEPEEEEHAEAGENPADVDLVAVAAVAVEVDVLRRRLVPLGPSKINALPITNNTTNARPPREPHTRNARELVTTDLPFSVTRLRLNAGSEPPKFGERTLSHEGDCRSCRRVVRTGPAALIRHRPTVGRSPGPRSALRLRSTCERSLSPAGQCMARHQPVALDATVEVTKTPSDARLRAIQRVGARRRVQLVRPASRPSLRRSLPRRDPAERPGHEQRRARPRIREPLPQLARARAGVCRGRVAPPAIFHVGSLRRQIAPSTSKVLWRANVVCT